MEKTMRGKIKLVLGLCAISLAQQSFAAETLVWHEEFNTPKLNKAYWTPEINFVRNIEAAQIYTDRSKNLAIRNGALTLTAYAEHFESTRWKPESPHWWESRKEANYTSGSINSAKKVEFRYGRVEIRAKLEHGRAVWPALCMIVNNPGGWPSCGEIDILEYVSQNPNTAHATLHYTKDGKYQHPTAPHTMPNPVAGEWHLYGLNWTPEKLELTFDKQVIFSMNLDEATQADGKNPFRDGLYHFILNLAIDGWAETPVAEDYPRAFYVDYVRLYQDKTIEGTELVLTPQQKPRKVKKPKTPSQKPKTKRAR
jgi:beta-glucanase (GH16 family)